MPDSTVKLFMGFCLFAVTVMPCCADDEQKAQGLDMVSDTVATTFNKVNALLEGKLEVTMSPDKTDTVEEFTTNAIGQKVPKTSAIKSSGSLHNDQPL